MDNMGRENLIIAVMLSIFLFALIFGGDARRFDMGRPWKFPSKESVARAEAFLDDNPVVDGYILLLITNLEFLVGEAFLRRFLWSDAI